MGCRMGSIIYTAMIVCMVGLCVGPVNTGEFEFFSSSSSQWTAGAEYVYLYQFGQYCHWSVEYDDVTCWRLDRSVAGQGGGTPTGSGFSV